MKKTRISPKILLLSLLMGIGLPTPLAQSMPSRNVLIGIAAGTSLGALALVATALYLKKKPEHTPEPSAEYLRVQQAAARIVRLIHEQPNTDEERQKLAELQRDDIASETLKETPTGDFASPTGLPYCEYPLFTIDIKGWAAQINAQQLFNLPDAFRALGQNYTFVHPVVTLQIGNSCGLHAVCNAKAIEELVATKQVITPAKIQQKVSEVMQRYQRIIQYVDGAPRNYNVMLSPGNMRGLTAQMELQNVHVLGALQPRAQVAPQSFNPDAIDIERLAAAQAADQQAYQQSKNQKIAHYICNINGNHWVTLSFVRTRQGVTVYYMDSQNKPLQIEKGRRVEVLEYTRQLVAL